MTKKHAKDLTLEEIKFITNYLDDFLFLALTASTCDKMVLKFLDLCQMLGVPVAEDKTEWGCIRIVFLGILLDGQKFVLSIPEDKRICAVNMLNYFIEKKKATVKEMERLVGYLNFLIRAIVPGRAFTRRMYAKFATAKQKLASHHHIKIDAEFKSDCQVWLQFLTNFNETIICQPFIDLNKEVTVEELSFYSDASANENLGYGCIFDNKWSFGQWEKGFIKNYDNFINIEFLELYALCMGIFMWGNQLCNKRIVVFCNNQGVCAMINNTTSGCHFCMTLIRKLMLKCLQLNLTVYAKFVRGKQNIFSDSLSRLNFKRFWEHAEELSWKFAELPMEPATELWLLSVYWKNNCTHLM